MNRSLHAIPCILCCILMAISYAGIAQGNFAQAKNKLNQKSNQNVDQKADTAIETNGNAPILQQYSRYNFIPGDQLIYTEDFSLDAIGDLPLDWNSSGKAEVESDDS